MISASLDPFLEAILNHEVAHSMSILVPSPSKESRPRCRAAPDSRCAADGHLAYESEVRCSGNKCKLAFKFFESLCGHSMQHTLEHSVKGELVSRETGRNRKQAAPLHLAGRLQVCHFKNSLVCLDPDWEKNMANLLLRVFCYKGA